ncbi:hypothetical protein [Salinisphaera sp. S4-8]|uniref:hypothetical protein n=1 Tax=Salinisphaera sp. S4-8 TaxID=633357 RepID=UPI00333EC3FD
MSAETDIAMSATFSEVSVASSQAGDEKKSANECNEMPLGGNSSMSSGVRAIGTTRSDGATRNANMAPTTSQSRMRPQGQVSIPGIDVARLPAGAVCM